MIVTPNTFERYVSRSRSTGGLVRTCDTTMPDTPPEVRGGSRWIVVCEHDLYVEVASGREASYVRGTPEDWCPACEALADRPADPFVVADEREETEPCQAGTPGCCVDHAASPRWDSCQPW